MTRPFSAPRYPAACIALAGNPNVGKSSIFNALTGSAQHVGNWPGKTVERQEGTLALGESTFTVVDLPGTYSLNAYSAEEIITRDFLIGAHPRLVIAVADASNLERNLYLVTQLIELGVPLVIALNMVDTAQQRGVRIDYARLSERLGGIPVLETVASRSAGLEALRTLLERLVTDPPTIQPPAIDYGPELEPAIGALQGQIATDPILSHQFRPRWLAIKLLERDDDLRARLEGAGYHALIATADAASEQITAQIGDDPETLITEGRYQFIATLLQGAVSRAHPTGETRSDRLDRIAAHPIWGVPIFLLLMWLLFQFTANVSAPALDWIDSVIGGPVTRSAEALLKSIGLGESWVEALIIDGVIAGVGGVLVFVPVLIALYFAVAVLEDSGYMARSAFVMDGVMRRIGLHGKSFLPLIVGFGCTVPAVYATRTLENETDRKLTGFLTTFMSCGARLPVYVVFGTAFFGAKSGNLVFSMYLLGIAIALLTGLLLKRTVYRDVPVQPFLLELPPYRLPNLRSVGRQVWQRTRAFLANATTIILASSVIIWLLMAIPVGEGGFADVRAEDSLFGTLSRSVALAFDPAGFGSWQATGALITGFVAKEVVISTMNQVYVEESAASTAGDAEADTAPSLAEETRTIANGLWDMLVLTAQEAANILPRTLNVMPGVRIAEARWLGMGGADEDTTALESALRNAFAQTAGSPERGKLAAVAFNVFVLLYVPCMATVAAMRGEFGARWMLAQVTYTLGIAWLAAVIVFQGGLLLGLV